ncbi:MAG: acyl carrier protein [bacterium]|nr:acyl carrier protein [bacterium]
MTTMHETTTVLPAGRLGLEEYVEPRVRGVVADRLGVEAQDLVASVSLRDDLAADSLDLLEVAIALEGAFGIRIPERYLDLIRTYDDLVAVVLDRIATSQRAEAAGSESPPVHARVMPAAGLAHRGVERSMRLTPYLAQTLADDVRLAGPGARLELTVQGTGGRRALAHVRSMFARMMARGTTVTVRSDERAGARSRAA